MLASPTLFRLRGLVYMAKYAFLLLFSKDAFLLLFLGMVLVALLWEARHKLKYWNLIFRDKLVRICARNWTKLFLGMVGVVLLWAGIEVSWHKLEVWNLVSVSGDKLVKIYAKNWAKGEYKTCILGGEITEPRELICDFDSPDEGKVFKVRFLLIAHIKEPGGNRLSYWNCRKNGDNEPMFSCEWQSPPK
jgi:hypothetical protein